MTDAVGSGADAAPLARLDVDVSDGVHVVSVHGELDISNVALLQDAVFEIPNSALGVVLGLDGTDYIDSSAIRLLFELRDRLSRRGQTLIVVTRAGSNVRRVLEMTAFVGVSEADRPSVDEAVAAIRSGAEG